jgi:ABC-type sugar transport system permease subunit
MSTTTATTMLPVAASRGRAYARRYWMFAVPAAVVVFVVILFPWLFTLFMSVHDWKVTGATPFVGLANYAKMLHDERFLLAVVRTLYFTVASVIAPLLLGVWAAVCFASNFKGRGLARTIFVLPMMATPVAVALVWTMMFHPTAWRPQLPALDSRPAAIELGVRQLDRDPHAGDGRNMAMDPAGHADRARRHCQPADRSV